MRVLARSVADSARIDSEHSPVREAETRARLAAVIAELSAAVRAYGQLLEAEPVSPEHAAFAAEPITEALEDHLEEAQRQQDQLADLLSTNPAGQPEGWQLRGEILAHVDRLRSELAPSHLPEPAGQAAAAGPAAEGAARAAGPAPERAAPQRVARRSVAAGPSDRFVGDRAAAAAEPERHAGTGQADRVPGEGQAQVARAAMG